MTQEWWPNNERYDLGVRWYGDSRRDTCVACAGTGRQRPKPRPLPNAVKLERELWRRFLLATEGIAPAARIAELMRSLR